MCNRNMEFKDKTQFPYGYLNVDEYEDRQRLFIQVCALSSTVTYSLETLSQHKNLIGQLQDEVDALMSQNEGLQL